MEAGIEADMSKVIARRSELFAQNEKNWKEVARQTRILENANQRTFSNKWYDNIFPYFRDRRLTTAFRNSNNARKNLDALHKKIDEHRFIDWELKKKQYYLHDLLSGMKK